VTLPASDLRSARWAPFGIAVALALVGAWYIIRRGPGPDRISQAVWDECKARYAAAPTHGDTVLVDSHIPIPGLQRQRLRKCWDFRTNPQFR
jgi:hypothetical protein